jgi:hypothetical protein
MLLRAACAAVAAVLIFAAPALAAQTVVVRNDSGAPIEVSLTDSAGLLYPAVNVPPGGAYIRNISGNVHLQAHSTTCGHLAATLDSGLDWTVQIDRTGTSCTIATKGKSPKGK